MSPTTPTSDLAHMNGAVSEVLIMSDSGDGVEAILPGLVRTTRHVDVVAADEQTLSMVSPRHVVIVDARLDPYRARRVLRLARNHGVRNPLLALVDEAGLGAVTGEWEVDDVLVDTASPAEIETRFRLTYARTEARQEASSALVRHGALSIDTTSHRAMLDGLDLRLTFMEFELLTYLARQAGRVCSRGELLRRVWGKEQLAGTRTVDVHVRRIRAKLGVAFEDVIVTVRNVGYRFAPPSAATGASTAA